VTLGVTDTQHIGWRALGLFGLTFFLFRYLIQIGIIENKDTSTFRFKNLSINLKYTHLRVFFGEIKSKLNIPISLMIIIFSIILIFIIKNKWVDVPLINREDTTIIKKYNEMNAKEKLQYQSDKRFKN